VRNAHAAMLLHPSSVIIASLSGFWNHWSIGLRALDMYQRGQPDPSRLGLKGVHPHRFVILHERVNQRFWAALAADLGCGGAWRSIAPAGCGNACVSNSPRKERCGLGPRGGSEG